MKLIRAYGIFSRSMASDRYVDVLSELVDKVVELPGDPHYPDCCFVEDTAVVAQNRAVLCHMGHPSRRGEGGAVGAALASLGFEVIPMPADEDYRVDGGDVLNTGRDMFVGLSDRTTEVRARFQPPHPRVVIT